MKFRDLIKPLAFFLSPLLSALKTATATPEQDQDRKPPRQPGPGQRALKIRGKCPRWLIVLPDGCHTTVTAWRSLKRGRMSSEPCTFRVCPSAPGGI